MVEVFKTTVERREDADEICFLLLHRFPANKINFDLYDCDKILRVEGDHISIPEIELLVHASGFGCEILE